MYDDIISNAKTAYSSKTGNKTKAIKNKGPTVCGRNATIGYSGAEVPGQACR